MRRLLYNYLVDALAYGFAAASSDSFATLHEGHAYGKATIELTVYNLRLLLLRKRADDMPANEE